MTIEFEIGDLLYCKRNPTPALVIKKEPYSLEGRAFRLVKKGYHYDLLYECQILVIRDIFLSDYYRIPT